MRKDAGIENSDPSSTKAVLAVQGLGKRFARAPHLVRQYGLRDIGHALLLGRTDGTGALRNGEFWAFRNLSFDLGPGEALGVIGRNGSGKTTLLRCIHGLSPPDEGQVVLQAPTSALIDLGAGFDAHSSGREAIWMEAALLGMDPEAVELLEHTIVSFAELEDVIDAPLSTYSTGMLLRLGYAVAAHLDPGILLVDEVLAVGDPAFQHKCVSFLLDYKRAGGSLVLVSHDLWQIRAMCDRCIVLEEGAVFAQGGTEEAISCYMELLDSRAQKATAKGTRHWSSSGEASEGVVEIRSVDFSGTHGHELQSGAPAVIAVEVENPGPTLFVDIVAAIDAEDTSIRVWEHATPRADPVCLEPGSNVVACEIGRLDLVARPYQLTVVVRPNEGADRSGFRAAEQVVRVIVGDHAVEDQAPHLMLGSIGRLETQWYMDDHGS